MRARRIGGVLAAGVALAGCDAGGLATAWQLRDLDPARTDPAALRVAVAAPEVVRPRVGSVQMRAIVRTAGDEEVFRFALVPVAPEVGDWALGAGEAIHVFRIAPGDLQGFARFRKAVLAARDAGGGGELSVDAPLCRTSQAMPHALPVTIWLNAAELERYVRLSGPVDLWGEAGGVDREAFLPRCGA